MSENVTSTLIFCNIEMCLYVDKKINLSPSPVILLVDLRGGPHGLEMIDFELFAYSLPA